MPLLRAYVLLVLMLVGQINTLHICMTYYRWWWGLSCAWSGPTQAKFLEQQGMSFVCLVVFLLIFIFALHFSLAFWCNLVVSWRSAWTTKNITYSGSHLWSESSHYVFISCSTVFVGYLKWFFVGWLSKNL